MALTKIDDRGVKYPLDLLDSEKIRFGTGNDLELYHDGTSSYIVNGTGNLHIRNSGSNHIKIQPNPSAEGIVATANGAVGIYYDGVKKFETNANGVEATGNVDLTGLFHINYASSTNTNYMSSFNNNNGNMVLFRGDGIYVGDNMNTSNQVGGPNNQKIHLDTNGTVKVVDSAKFIAGSGDDLQIYHDGSNSFIPNTTGKLFLRSDTGIVLQDAGGNESFAEFNDNGAVELYYDNAKVFETLEYGARIKRPSGGSTDLEVIGCEGQDAYIHVWADEGDDNADKWKMGALTDGSFRIQNYADGAWENSIIANGGGNTKLFHNNTEVLETTSGGVQVNGTTNSLKVTHTGGSCVVLERNSKQFTFNANYGAQDTYSTFNVGSGMGYKFYLNGNPYITINSSGVLSGDLNDTSDEKKKKNITSIPDGAIAKIKQLRPVNFNWKNPLNTADQSGFIAQEVKTVIPDLVSGEEYDEAKGDIGYAINTTGVVAHLTKALQEAITKIETLETEVAALKAK